MAVKAGHSLMMPVISVLGPALGGTFLIPNPWIGAILWLAVFQDLHHAAFALFGLVVSEAAIRTVRIPEASPVEGSLKANAVLAAIAGAWLMKPLALSAEIQLAIVAAAAVLATFVTAAIARALSGKSLPALMLGYCTVAAMLFSIFPDWTYIASASIQWWPVPVDLAGWVKTFFGTLGALMFLPTIQTGVILSIAIILWSRAAFLAGVVGWVAGTATAVALGHLGVIYYWMPTAYNFFLAGMGLGAVFMLPGRANLLIAALGGSAASIIAVSLQHLFPAAAFGYLALAASLAIWIGIYALEQAGEPRSFVRNRASDIPPEEAWWRTAYWGRRAGSQPFLTVPVAGPVQVTQGAEGRLSHIGPWQHALDLERPSSGDPARGRESGDESIWDAPVLAPAAGRIEMVENSVPDNPLGISNFANNWGNYVMIRLDQASGWVLIAHLRQGSVAVRSGERVAIGTYLGRVGSSGRSPIPHLHLQVQRGPWLGAPTMPFRLANYLATVDPTHPLSHWTSAALPNEGAVISLATVNPSVHKLLASISPGRSVWTVEATGHVPRSMGKTAAGAAAHTTISLDQAGRHVFGDGRRGALTMQLGTDAWRVIELDPDCSPLIKLLALALPSIPFAAANGMRWSEPVPLICSGLPRWIGLVAAPYVSDPFPSVRCRCVRAPTDRSGILEIEAELESGGPGLPSRLVCQLDAIRGPIRLEASFDGGTLVYSLLSFEPGFPFELAAA